MMMCVCRSERLLIVGSAALNICCTPMRSETIKLTLIRADAADLTRRCVVE